MPRPVSDIAERNTIPMVKETAPRIGQCRYLPLRVVSRPVLMLASVTPAMIGINNSPEFVGDTPVTACKKSGMKAFAP